jgi:hypothetical protein
MSRFFIASKATKLLRHRELSRRANQGMSASLAQALQRIKASVASVIFSCR